MADEERSPIHEEFISSLPEDLQEGAPQYVEHWDKYVQDKFGQNAEEIKAWEPYSNIQIDDETAVNIRDIPPEELAELLAFREIANDPEKLRELAGIEPEETDEWVDPTVAALQQQVTELASWKQQQEKMMQEQQQVAWQQEMVHRVDTELDKIKESSPGLNDEDIDFICALAAKYPQNEEIEQRVQKGFADFQKIIGRAETNLFQKKAGQPKPAESGGAPNTAAEPVRNYEDAGEAARARLRQALSG